MKLILTTAAAALLLPSAAFAQGGPTATSTANASAEVILPLSISCGPMHFAEIAPIASATYVGLPAAGEILDDPSNVVVPGTRTNAQPSHCDVEGEAGMSFHVTLPTGATLTSGGNSMTLSHFVMSTDADADRFNRLLEDDGNGNGENGFNVGARLNVGANQAPGLYSGPFVVTVQYN